MSWFVLHPPAGVRVVSFFIIAAMGRLAIHRDYLIERNHNIPTDLPAVWAILGHPKRAEALAHSISWPEDRVRALTAIADAVTRSGDLERATEVVNQVEELARTIAIRDGRGGALADLVVPAAEAGDLDRADALVRTIPDAREKSEALAGLAVKVAETGDLDRAAELVNQAEELAYASSTAYERNVALVSVVEGVRAVSALSAGIAKFDLLIGAPGKRRRDV